MHPRTTITLIAVLLGLFVVGVFGWSVWRRNTELAAAHRERRAPDVLPTDPILGNPRASITLIEYGDFACPACRVQQPALRVLMARFADDLQLVWKDFPITELHPESFGAAEAARCAQQQNAFWQMHDALYARLGELNDALYPQLASSLGLDIARFRTCMETHATRALVEQARTEGDRAGVDGTPAFFLNGQYGTAAPSEEYLRALRTSR